MHLFVGHGLPTRRPRIAVGVSRQTIYNEFTNKQGLAEALVISIGSGYADECERIIAESPDIRAAFRDSVHPPEQVAEESASLFGDYLAAGPE